jgi:triosephosphate isomerase
LIKVSFFGRKSEAYTGVDMRIRRPVVLGNWKMNLDHQQAASFIMDLVRSHAGQWAASIDAGVLPPFTSIQAVSDEIHKAIVWPFKVGAQNVSSTLNGAYTGDISADMLAALGCTYVLIGHSEQRLYHPDSNPKLPAKTHAVLDNHMIPVVCIGETMEERLRDDGIAAALKQLDAITSTLSYEESGRIIIAYEPIWAIGTGQNADAKTANRAVNDVRGFLRDQFDDGIAKSVRILYGGSVSADNAGELMTAQCVDGFLIGGASLDPYHFSSIMETVGKAATQ